MNGYLVRGHMKFYDTEETTTKEEFVRYVKNGSLIERSDIHISSILKKHCDEVRNEMILKKYEVEYDYAYCKDALANVLFDLTVLSSKLGITLEELMKIKMSNANEVAADIRHKM
jgi:hypothetical protein